MTTASLLQGLFWISRSALGTLSQKGNHMLNPPHGEIER